MNRYLAFLHIHISPTDISRTDISQHRTVPLTRHFPDILENTTKKCEKGGKNIVGEMSSRGIVLESIYRELTVYMKMLSSRVSDGTMIIRSQLHTQKPDGESSATYT